MRHDISQKAYQPCSGHTVRTWLLCLLLPFNLQLLSAQIQTGKASFYAMRFTGQRTASGERLHHDSMTCAHRTLPFGTLLKVTHGGNGRSVIVRVNDRGPFTRGRIIDLSWGAARELGMIRQGIATVTVEPADGITIPLRASDATIELPALKVESALTADSLNPVWKEELYIDHKKVQHHMHRTAQKSLLQRIEDYLGW